MSGLLVQYVYFCTCLIRKLKVMPSLGSVTHLPIWYMYYFSLNFFRGRDCDTVAACYCSWKRVIRQLGHEILCILWIKARFILNILCFLTPYIIRKVLHRRLSLLFSEKSITETCMYPLLLDKLTSDILWHCLIHCIPVGPSHLPLHTRVIVLWCGKITSRSITSTLSVMYHMYKGIILFAIAWDF